MRSPLQRLPTETVALSIVVTARSSVLSINRCSISTVRRQEERENSWNCACARIFGVHSHPRHWLYKRQTSHGQEGVSDIKNRLVDMGRGEERVRCMERVTWKCTLPYVKEIANGNLLYGSGNSNRVSVSTQSGGMGTEMGGRFKREGIYVYLWLIHVDVWQKTTKFCKAIILQLKN